MLFQYFVNGRYYGEAERNKTFRVGTFHTPTSLLFICPGCGSTWAQIVAKPPARSRYQAVMQVCRRCGGIESLYHPYDPDSPAMPYDLACRELDLIAEHGLTRWNDFEYYKGVS